MTATDVALPVLGGQRVLVVDPDQDTAESLTVVLRLNGFDAHCVRSAAEALSELVDRRPGVVLIEPDLPGADGWDLIRRCRAAAHNPRVIVTTGWSGPAQEAAARAAGADLFLLKPADPAHLTRLLSTHKPQPAGHC